MTGLRPLLALVALLAAAWSAAAGAQQGSTTSSTSDPTAAPVARPEVDERATGRLPLAPGTALSGPVDPETYRVGPGDVLVLQLWGPVSRTVPLEVGPEGTVLVPGGGSVRVEGMTLARVRADVLRRVREQYRGVEMDLRLLRPRIFLVYLTGQVRSPGPVQAMGSSRLGDVVTAGQLEDDASRRRIEVLRRDGTRELADLDLFLRTGESSLNPLLRDGDVIQVPTATEFVHAQGALAQPGRYELGPQDSLLTLLRLAGEPLPSAEAQRVLLVKFPSPFRSDSTWTSLADIYSRTFNPVLADGDRVYVYFIPQYHLQHEAQILGEVERPGFYPIVQGRTRISDLVNAAESFLPSADLSSIRLHRRNPAATEKDPELDRLLTLSRNELTATEYEVLRTKLAALREDYRVDWNRMQRDRELDLLLRDGDIVRVERLVTSIRVDGEVRRPGIVEYAPGLSVEDYVRHAGGFTDRAWPGKVRVTRAVTGQVLLARNVRALDPGDFVWVPEKPDATVWQQARDILTALGTIATVVIAIRSVN